MTERIDHAAEAVALRNLASGALTQPQAANLLAAAHVHATLALFEQQRIANLIALEVSNRIDTGIFQTGDEEETPWGQQKRLVLTDEIREALGLK